MPREAKLFERFKGSSAKAVLKLTGNMPPNWIERARTTRKRREADLAAALQRLQDLQGNRPRASAAIKASQAEVKVLLQDWELSYQKECFYNGVRILLELSRDGKSER